LEGVLLLDVVADIAEVEAPGLDELLEPRGHQVRAHQPPARPRGGGGG